MSKKLAFLLTCLALGSAGAVHAQMQPKQPDPYTSGADANSARDPYSQGARVGDKFDPYSQGANQSTQQNLAPSDMSPPRDPYSQGANSGQRDPYSEGARTINRDYPFDPSSGALNRRNPYFQGS